MPAACRRYIKGLLAVNDLHRRTYLLPLFHSSQKHKALTRDQETAQIHGCVGSVFVDRLPLSAVHIEAECNARPLGGMAIIATSAIVVNPMAASRKVDPLSF